jgi:elongation factor P
LGIDMGDTTDLYKGGYMRYDGNICQITDLEFRKPGKGGAFYKVKLRDIDSGKQKEHTYNSGASVEMVRIERRPYQFLFVEGENYVFMNNETYEQIPIHKDMLADQIKYMSENEICQLAFDGDTVLSVEIPQHVNLEVTQTEPGFKGDTASNTTKPATVATGAEIQVPLFVNEGDVIRIDTTTDSYIERVNK